jgi:hypothetical protein
MAFQAEFQEIYMRRGGENVSLCLSLIVFRSSVISSWIGREKKKIGKKEMSIVKKKTPEIDRTVCYSHFLLLS